MMVLLSTLAIGLLSLSSITLRSSQSQANQAIARANARLALQLAIGELQKQTGPDQRITIAADQLAASSDGKATAAQPTRSHWTGVYKSWTDTAANRPTPEFQRWLVSAPETDARNPAYAKSASGGSKVEVVGKGTVGASATGFVEVPLIDCQASGKVASRFGWWVGDQGVKAPLATPAPGTSKDLAATRQGLQSSPRTALELATTGGSEKPFATVTAANTQVRNLTGWKQGELLASAPDAPKPLFHDLAGRSTGLLTNVRSGGFRKDLSMQLEQPLSTVMNTALYTAGGANGINQGELSLYYNLYKQLKTGGSFTYTTGGSLGSNTPYLQIAGNLATLQADPSTLYKQPTFVSTKTILSFYGIPATVSGAAKVQLYMVVDPIVTYWNPLDVPLVITPAYHSVKFWQLPYDFKLKRASGDLTLSMTNMMGGSANYLTFVIGKSQPVVLRPGEVVMFSQGPNTSPTTYNPGLNTIQAKAGWNFGGGVAIPVKNGSSAIYLDTTETLKYEVLPNGNQGMGTQAWFLTANDTFYKEDRTASGESLGLNSGMSIDNMGGKPSARLYANQNLPFFDKVPASATRPLTASQLVGRKEPLMIFSFTAKTEQDTDRPGRFLARYNPRAGSDFQTLSADELETLPFEVRVEPLDSWRNRNLEVSPSGQSYFGGGVTAQSGTPFVTTHSVPREPLASLAAFQNAFANGFTWSGTQLSQGSYLLPQISHAIGNSIAPAVIGSNQTESSLDGPRPLADHSYLANKALWDDWFLSSAAPQTADSFSAKIGQRQVTQQFFKGIRPLPNSRYLYSPVDTGETPEALLGRWFDGDTPNAAAATEFASAIRVEGMFNVNSTSVEAWRTFLAGLRNQQVAVRDASGAATAVNANGTPVVGLQNPEDVVAEGDDLGSVVSSPQWTGHRVLKDKEIDELARAIVIEVRKRGPFLSLADFVNRRPGSDKDLAKAGTLQSALDSADVSINKAYNSGSRAAAVATGRGYAFPEAENGPAAYGIPGVVKQADILTPIAPYLSARSDTFVIRGYGESVDSSGKVTARAWCEAEVSRDSALVDPVNKSTTATTSLSPLNQLFGRRYQIVSFRWLLPSEV
ncbi:hypothetical protein llg_19390 [Luteolibacter sp. LG18]|nr:hypothetical protein llg_19390 [Luteolibacter sp. LG18]